jgi:hypothetical protein
MRINMKRIIVFVFFPLISNSIAQEAKLGFRKEIFGPLYERTGFGKTFVQNPMPPNLYFVLAFKPTENFQLDLRPGISFVADYGGVEFGGYLKYFPSESVYLLAAYNVHFMGGEAHGFHSNNETTFTMPGLGVGFVTEKYSSLEFMVFIPTPKEWKYDVEIKSGEFEKITSKFDVIFKIGFGFDWPI